MKLWQLINAIRDGLFWGLMLGAIAVAATMALLHVMEAAK